MQKELGHDVSEKEVGQRLATLIKSLLEGMPD